MKAITLLPERHRFFNELATAQAATGAFLLGQWHNPDRSAPRTIGPIRQMCLTVPLELEFDPDEVLGSIMRRVWPSVIHLKLHPSRIDRSIGTKDPTTIQILMASLYEHAFVTYYAKNAARMIATHGRDRDQWPNVLRFGRIVRNAFAHGGTVHVRDGRSAKWGGVTYSEAANGQRVLYNDLTSGDLTLLMVEMDAQF